jgi:hypothetical protein
MTRKRFVSIAILLTLLMGMLGLQASLVTAKDETQILKFESMVGVSAPFAGAANAIRTVPGAGAAWVVGSAKGTLSTDGDLELKVRGLVLASNGNNPAGSFRAVVSCLTSGNIVQNVTTAPFPATMGLASAGGGNAEVEVSLTLPQPCIAPIVFVTSAGGNWFAVTGG